MTDWDVPSIGRLAKHEERVSQQHTDPCEIALRHGAEAAQGDDAIARLQQAARNAARPVPYLERLGWAFVAKARSSEDPGLYLLAEQCVLCIESKEPHSPEALLLRGHVLHSMHRFAEAEALARQLVERRGTWLDHALLGDLLLERGALAEAVEEYQRMMDEKPGPAAYSRAAHVRWLMGDLAGAIRLMSMAARAVRGGAPESAAWMHVRLALYALQAGDTTAAVALADEASALQPNYAPALFARGRALLAQNRMAEAAEAFEQATALHPLPENLWALADVLRANGRHDAASKVEARLRKSGASEDPRTFSLYLATRGEEPDIATSLAWREIEARPDIFSHDALAWSLAAAGRLDEAHNHMARALAHGTQDARLFLHAAVIANRLGNVEEAQLWAERATALQHMLLPSEREQLPTIHANGGGKKSAVRHRQNLGGLS
jgi:tetratricopeptide (TPR) repeat protein